MALPPLTHHEILGLVGPFSRAGRRVDLEATNRLERRLVFKPVEHAGDSGAPSGVREDLALESPYAGTFRLTRSLTGPGGLSAVLVAEGPEPGELLALVAATAPATQLRAESGFAIALSHVLEAPAQPGGVARLLLTEGVAEVGGLRLTLRMPAVPRRPADLRLSAPAGDTIELPQDLLAVVGWHWAPLKRLEAGSWGSKLRLRGRGPARSRDAERKLSATARHLAQTLAEPPRRFHERFLVARWGAAVRRTLPVLTAVGVVGVAMLVPVKVVEAHPFVRLLLMNLPLLCIGLSFTLQEMSRIELPPRPRLDPAPAWRRTSEAPVAPALDARPG
jgi:hypothetical protein